ncbi:inositol monophosphatase [Mesorhizobium sp.]|uniref:inositol monophosphatase family protein n=1 Tax=Mesorhizobium sp. TaxID=1871066 RepID=UPI000FE8B154|nr:inositol monophosphatase [Mesorhizobium sp.]RWL46643.1 MAG: inositol monophosphatase [Mesorhizobium sp.]
MTFDDRAIDWLADLLAEAATAEIMPRFRRLGEGDVRQKTSAADLVTEADVNAERLITARLRERYPDAMVVGEEACSDNPALLSGLGDAALAFVIDPVDGTFNFASGVPLFGVMAGVVVNGETVAGIIHDPVGKDWLIGAKGAGSHILEEPERSRLARNQTKTLSQFAYRCAAHEYRLLASGHAHFVLYNKLMPWDHLAGALIHQEAGGHVARVDGSAYLPSHVDGGLLVAPDKQSWDELRRELWAE